MRTKILKWLLQRWTGAENVILGEDEYGKFTLMNGDSKGEGEGLGLTMIVRPSTTSRWYVWHSRWAGLTDVPLFEFGVGRWVVRVVPAPNARMYAPLSSLASQALSTERTVIEAFLKGLTDLQEGNPTRPTSVQDARQVPFKN